MKLLIVDDEPIIVRGLLQLVDYGALGYGQILSATDSVKALSILRAEKPDAMLSDIAMPGLTGLELLRLIRDERLPTEVIFLSGFRSFEYAQEALSLGARDYLVKPVDVAKLSEDLRDIAKRRQQHRQQDFLQRQLETLSQETETVFSTVALDQRPFGLICFHLAVDQQQSSLSSGLLHFSALSKGEAYCTQKGCMSFIKDDYLCAIVHATEHDCPQDSQRIAAGCADAVEKALSRPFNYFIYPDTLHNTQEIPDAWAFCTRQLSIPHQDQQTNDSLIERVKEHIAQHYGEDLTLEVMSDTFAMNPSYFSSFFHQKTGIRYKDYLTRVRITEAKRLLMQSDLKVYEICERVGFTDVRYFSQVFQKATGILPKHYKKSH